MRADLTAHLPLTARGLARIVSGLALVAVLTTACGGGDDEVLRVIPELDDIEFIEPTTVLAAEVESEEAEQSTEPLDPAQGRAAEISGAYQLYIPSIGVEAPVVSITSNDDRVLVPPRDPTIVGWWSQGKAPGSPTGSAVLVGHTVRSGGGVFDDVGSLSVGDSIRVQGSGSALNYQIDSVEVLSKEDLARRAEEIFNQSGPGRLVVITCDDWDGTSWRSNIVTIASPS